MDIAESLSVEAERPDASLLGLEGFRKLKPVLRRQPLDQIGYHLTLTADSGRASLLRKPPQKAHRAGTKLNSRGVR